MIEKNVAISERQDAVVYIVDDDQSLRTALEDLLESVGLPAKSFASTQEFLRNQRLDTPSCLVLDIRMPGMSGLDFQREMAKWNIRIPIIFITAHGDIPMSVQAMKAGAVEFLTKPFRDQDLLDAIRLGIERDRVQRQDATIIADLRQRFADLTEGERQVLALVVSGLLNKQIAAHLGVSEITVKVRRGHIMRKMHARSLAELVRMADRLGIATEKMDYDR
jgi:FixJ family two-component response regulator